MNKKNLIDGSLAQFLALLAMASYVLPSAALGQSDSCASATPITGMGSFSFNTNGALSSGFGCGLGDHDLFWQWTVPANGDYLISVDNLTPFSVPYVSISRQPLCTFVNGFQCAVGAGGGVELDDAVEGETILIQVGSLMFFDQGISILTISPSPCSPPNFTDDALKDNDSLATATPVGAGVIPSLFISNTDPDYFSVTIPAGQNLVVDAIGITGSAKLFLFNENGAALGPFGPNFVYEPRVDTPVTMRLAVTAEADNGAKFPSCSDYDLQIGFTPDTGNTTRFCDAPMPNGAGFATTLQGDITVSLGLDLRLTCQYGPGGQFGYLVVGTQFQDPGVAIGLGELCLAGQVGRYNLLGTPLNSVGQFNALGVFGFGPESSLSYIPPADLPSPLGVIQPGMTLNFQLWHREPNGGSHFSSGVSATF